MKLAYVDLMKHDRNNVESGTQTWGVALDIPYEEYKSDLSGYDAFIVAFYGGTYHIPFELKTRYPNKKIIGIMDYNSWELHEVLSVCNCNSLNAVDIWICPKPISDWLKVVFGKPVIETYRPYDPKLFEYIPYEKRDKIILVSEHTKTKQIFTEKMVAKRILEKLPDGDEYEIVIKDTCRGDHPYPTAREENSSLKKHFNLEFRRYDQWNPAPIPLLSIDHYPAALFGGFHASNALFGTPTIGVTTSDANYQAFPNICCQQYDLVSMVDRGVKLLTNREEWERISNYARKYAEDNWSFNACKKIFTSKLEPLLQKVNNINKLDI